MTKTCGCGDRHSITCPVVASTQPNAMVNARGDVFYPDSAEDAAWFTAEHGARSRVNAILTFRDETGGEWLAGADIGPLCRFDGKDGPMVEEMEVEQMKDRALVLADIRIVAAPKETP